MRESSVSQQADYSRRKLLHSGISGIGNGDGISWLSLLAASLRMADWLAGWMGQMSHR